MRKHKVNAKGFQRNYKKILNKIKKRNTQMANEIEKEKSRMPQCLATINDILSKIERAKTGCFNGAPDYYKQELENIHSTLMAMFKNISSRMSGNTPEISVAKVIACADSLRGVDEESRSQLLALAESMSEDVKTLSPEVIQENLNSFRVIMDESNIEANEEEIVFNAQAQFVIHIDGKEYVCELNGKFPVPNGALTLKKVQYVRPIAE